MAWWDKYKKYLDMTWLERPTVRPSQAKPVLGAARRRELKAKLSLYRELCEARIMNDDGFVPKCDSLLFSSLAYVAGCKVDIGACERDGRWFRRPEKCCYENGRNSISLGTTDCLWEIY